MTSALEQFNNETDARVLLELLAAHKASAATFRRIAAALAAEVVTLAGDERSQHALDVARAFAAGQMDSATLAAANQTANKAFVASMSGVQAMARVAAVNASGSTVTAIGPALAAQSAALRAAEGACFTNAGAIEIDQIRAIREEVDADAFMSLVESCIGSGGRSA